MKDQPQHDSSTSFAHTEEQLQEAETNIERCFRALDERGEAGLQAELDRIYPPEEKPSGGNVRATSRCASEAAQHRGRILRQPRRDRT